MSDLPNLRKRIATEFSAPKRTLASRRASEMPLADDPHSLEPEEGFSAPKERHAALKPALAGAGLLGSAAILGTGIDAGFYLLSAGLAVAGISGAALLLKDWYRASTLPAAKGRLREEKASDSRWERSETSQLLSTIHDALGDIAIIREPGGKIVQANSVFLPDDRVAETGGTYVRSAGDRVRAGIGPPPLPRPHRDRCRNKNI